MIKTIFWEYIADSLKKHYDIKIDTALLKKAIEEMAYNGTVKPFVAYASQNILRSLPNRDLINFDET